MSEKIFLLYRGLSGSGKSTSSKKQLKQAEDKGLVGVICSADDYFVRDGKYEFKGNKLNEAHRECFNKFVDALVEGFDLVILDNTSIRIEEFETYVKVAKLAGYKVQIIEKKPKDDAELVSWWKRCVHDVPLDKVRSRWQQWEQLPKTMDVEVISDV